MTGCLLSSSIEQHVTGNYQQMSASVQAQIVQENPDPVQEMALVHSLIEQEKQSADRYKMLLIGVVIAVLVASTFIGFIVTWLLLNGYWKPVEEKYSEVMSKGRMLRNPGVQPLVNINVSTMSANRPEQAGTQYARPPVRHYKVSTP